MIRIFCISLCFLSIFSSTALGEEPCLIRTISVSGTVEWKIVPDCILWTISLADADKNLHKAKEESDRRIKSVVALREKLSLDDGDLETGPVRIRREYERDEHGRSGEFKYYLISRNVIIRQRDLNRFDEFFEKLVGSTDMEVSFDFESSQLHEVRADMRLKALQVAKDKAAAMANVVGAKLGQVLSIDEYPPDRSSGYIPRSRESNPFNVSVVYGAPSVDLATDMFVPGVISQRVTVYVTFELK